MSELVERCPNDGQTAEWHQHTETGPDGNPRTNAAFIGCDWSDTVWLCDGYEVKSGARCHKPADHDGPHNGWAHYPGQLASWT